MSNLIKCGRQPYLTKTVRVQMPKGACVEDGYWRRTLEDGYWQHTMEWKNNKLHVILDTQEACI